MVVHWFLQGKLSHMTTLNAGEPGKRSCEPGKRGAWRRESCQLLLSTERKCWCGHWGGVSFLPSVPVLAQAELLWRWD